MRAVNRWVAATLAAVLAAAGVITLVEIVRAASGRAPLIVDWRSWATSLGRLSWSDTGPRLVCGLLAILGLGLVVRGLRRGTPSWFAASPVVPGSVADRAAARHPTAERTAAEAPGSPRTTVPVTVTFVSRRGLTRALRAAALSVDGVSRAAVRVRRRTARVHVRIRPRTAADAPALVAAAVRRALDAFDLATPPLPVLRVSRAWARHDRVVPERTYPETPYPANGPGEPTSAQTARTRRATVRAGGSTAGGAGPPARGEPPRGERASSEDDGPGSDRMAIGSVHGRR
jgi:hypothetical protein